MMLDMAATSTSGLAYSYAYVGKCLRVHVRLKNSGDSVKTRPLYARTAKDNAGSIRVLQKCGFQITGEDKGFSAFRSEEVEEFIFILDSSDSDTEPITKI